MKNLRCILIFVLLASCKTSHENFMEMTLADLREAYQDHRELAFYALSQLVAKDPNCESAEPNADQLLLMLQDFKDNFNYGNAIYEANMVKGYCAIRRDDVGSAKKFLALAGATSGSPSLDTFGLARADMRLAQELLKKGERAAVLDFLTACQKFWEKSDAYVARWKSEIDAGKIPEFR